MDGHPGVGEAGELMELAGVLGEARELGFLGPGEVRRHIEHAEAFADAVERAVGTGGRQEPPLIVVDLGSGAGVPGLAMARRWPKSSVDLLEGSVRRASFLTDAVDRLRLSGRVAVIADRAESVGRSPDRRGRYQVVVARSFGPPSVAAECAAPLLQIEGCLVVSEPPEAGRTECRWPPKGLGELGMSSAVPMAVDGYHFVAVRQITACPGRFPRRVGVPAKRPVF